MNHFHQRKARVVLAMLTIFVLSSCSFAKIVVARVQPRNQFVPTQQDPDVRYGEGSQKMAERVARAVKDSRELVERTHGTTFTRSPQVFVCRTECFLKFVPFVNEEVAAAHFGDVVFMNDEVLQQRDKLLGMPVENYLTHELAHLLLYERIGAVAYIRVPAWFREGIAVSVSHGAGAQACTPAEAAQNILAGRHFDPAENGSLFRISTASNFKGMRPSIFYREASLFVDYLRNRNPIAFQAALGAIFDGTDFQDSFAISYGQSISSQWPGFLASMSQLVPKQ